MSLDHAQDPQLVAFCEAEHPRLVGALSLYTNNVAVAEELAQEALIRVIARWPDVRDMTAPGAWAHRTGMNLAKSWFRRRGAERRALGRHGAPPMSDAGPDVAAVVAVREAVASLPLRQRRCVVLRHYLGYPVALTAQTLDLSEAAVTSLTHRGLAALRSRLGSADSAQEACNAR